VTSRKTAKRIARLLLGVMLFAQAAIALAACESFARTPALAVVAAQEQADAAKCHEESGANGNANLCLAHCLAADQSLDKPGVTIPPLAAAPVLALPSIDRLLPDAVAPRKVAVPPAAAPPPRILFRTLLI
jgi:hypothetical protein